MFHNASCMSSAHSATSEFNDSAPKHLECSVHRHWAKHCSHLVRSMDPVLSCFMINVIHWHNICVTSPSACLFCIPCSIAPQYYLLCCICHMACTQVRLRQYMHETRHFAVTHLDGLPCAFRCLATFSVSHDVLSLSPWSSSVVGRLCSLPESKDKV